LRDLQGEEAEPALGVGVWRIVRRDGVP